MKTSRWTHYMTPRGSLCRNWSACVHEAGHATMALLLSHKIQEVIVHKRPITLDRLPEYASTTFISSWCHRNEVALVEASGVGAERALLRGSDWPMPVWEDTGFMSAHYTLDDLNTYRRAAAKFFCHQNASAVLIRLATLLYANIGTPLDNDALYKALEESGASPENFLSLRLIAIKLALRLPQPSRTLPALLDIAA